MKPEFKRFEAQCEFKADTLDADGTFKGYASVFDVIDLDQDMIVKGAFKKTLSDWKKRKALPPVVWQHDFRNPVGPYKAMEEDDHGLAVEGLLLVDEVQKAREARALMKHKAVSGLSIGFITRKSKNGKDKDDRPIRVITELELLEVSIVTAAANPAARVTDVKNTGLITPELIAGLKSLKEFEEILREAGFTRSAATAFVAKCRKQGEPVEEKEAAKLIASLRDYSNQLSKGA
jgi:HK97 family phage prohead protease